MKRLLRIALTSGDTDGIGFEVMSKALRRVGPKANIQFYLWRSPTCSKKDLRRVDSSFRRVTVGSWPEALKQTASGQKNLIDIASDLSPAHWVEQSAQAAKLGHIDGIATAPISKTVIKEAGMKDIGHTDILKRISKAEDLFMTFLGEFFSVVLATGHIPMSQVSSALTTQKLEAAINAAIELRASLSPKEKRGIAVLGLNPHAGEKGIIGPEENTVHKAVLDKFKNHKVVIEGPLVPDASFTSHNWKKYCIFVANYHDQGLIPFKLVHKRHGVHVTLGLPFVRTSVDHGTAKDIFGKDKADYHSMLEAINSCIELCRSKLSEE